ncbi:MAG: hypothetical protein IKY44_00335 [Clostridia bacterium]|nr:hypothetical protein [Clostridia bacterium]
MKKIRSAHIVAIAFGIIVLFGMIGFLSVNSVLKPIYGAIFVYWDNDQSVSENLSTITDTIDNVISENVYQKNLYIDINGLAQRLIGKNVIDDVDVVSKTVKLKNGQLTFIRDKLDDEIIEDRAEQITSINDYFQKKNIDFLYVQLPSKIDEHDPQLPTGIEDYTMQNARYLSLLLSQKGISQYNTIDVLQNEYEGEWGDLFLKTDHHWTTEAAFLTYTKFADHLNQTYNWEIDQSVYNANNFSTYTYKDAFLGSQGKRVGRFYGGLDDISVIYPNFETSFEYSRNKGVAKRTGDYRSTLVFENNITYNYHEDFCYQIHLGGDFGYVKIVNNNNPDGKKLLIIKDSYADPLISLLSLCASEIELIDMRYFEDSMGVTLQEYLETSNPDMAMIMYSSLTMLNSDLYDFNLK